MRPTEKSRLHSWPGKKADFVEPMECEPVSKLQDSSQWIYEIKLDGYRAIAVKSDNKVSLFSRRRRALLTGHDRVDLLTEGLLARARVAFRR